jgi:hypothetical protein
MFFNIILGNHSAVHLVSPVAEYVQWTLSSCGYETAVTLNKLEKQAINIFFEFFAEADYNAQLLKMKRDYGLVIGQIATELIIDGEIPYFQEGEGARQIRNKERVPGFELMVQELDFLWSFLERTAASYKKAAKISEFFPYGSIAGFKPEIPSAPKDLDVVFFGYKTPHREAIIANCARHGIAVAAYGRGFPNGHQDPVFLQSALQRAKIGLNLVLEPPKAGLDVLDPRFASCGRIKEMLDHNLCIISEEIPLDNPYAPYMVSEPVELIPIKIKELLGTGRWRDTGLRLSDAFRREMDVIKVCRPVIARTINALNQTVLAAPTRFEYQA